MRPRRRSRVRKTPLPKPGTLLSRIQKSLDDDKAQDVAVIDLIGKSSLTDFMVFASGTSVRHIAAMAEHLRERLKAGGLSEVPIEGLPQCDWVLVDAGDVVVHLFRPQVRKFYNLEKMWSAVFPEAPEERPAL